MQSFREHSNQMDSVVFGEEKYWWQAADNMTAAWNVIVYLQEETRWVKFLIRYEKVREDYDYSAYTRFPKERCRWQSATISA